MRNILSQTLNLLVSNESTFDCEESFIDFVKVFFAVSVQKLNLDLSLDQQESCVLRFGLIFAMKHDF